MTGFSAIGALVKVAAVFALLFVTLKVVARLYGPGGRGSAAALLRLGSPARAVQRPVEVVARSPLGRNASIVVVRVGGSHLALGVSDHGVQVLREVEIEELAAPQEPLHDAPPAWTPAGANRQSWMGFVEQMRERTVRR